MRERKAIFWVTRKIYKRIPLILCMVLTNAGGALLGVLFALGTRGVIDSAVAGDRTAFFRACVIQLSIICGLLLSAMLSRYIRDRLVTDLDRDWKRSLMHSLLHGEYTQVSSFHSGELVNRLNNDVRVLDEGLVSALPGLVSMAVQLVAAVVVLLALEPLFTLLLVLLGIVSVIGTGFARRRLKEINKRVSQSDGKVLSFIQEALERLLVIQGMDLSQEVERRADRLLTERLQEQRRRRWISLIANTAVFLLYYLAGFAALVWCAVHLLLGNMTFGTLTVITQLVSQLQSPFVNLSGFIPQYAAMTAAAERLMELDGVQSYDVGKKTIRYQDVEAIGAQDLSFAYGEETVFQNTSFSVPKGAFVAVTGASGIGKSTLLKLMLGVIQPSGGMLFTEKKDKRTPLNRYTKGLFAYVPQGNFLFSGTVRDNLLISNPEADQQTIDYAVHVSAMDQFLSQLPEGLDTEIGENGTGLSEGQVQRLAIARAVLSGAPILLLDEATSALDVETERTILERIARMPDCTCIAVTHRPAALQVADWQLEVANKGIKTIKVK